MAEEKKQKSLFKIERSCTININDDIRIEYDADADVVAFISDEDESDAPLFQLSFEAFEDLFGTAKAERDRIKALEAAGKKS